MKFKQFVVKESPAFRLTVLNWKCLAPADLNALHFIQETIKDGEVVQTSTYEFFLTDNEVQSLAQGLLK